MRNAFQWIARRPLGKLFLVIGVSSLMGWLALWLNHDPGGPQSDAAASNEARVALDPIRIGSGVLGRSAMSLDDEECIVVRVPLKFIDFQHVNEQLAGDPSTPDDDLLFYQEDDDSQWYVPPDNLSEYSAFNCAAYALGDSIGLSRWDWLEPSPVGWTDDKCPAQAVLNQYFELVAPYPVSEIDWDELESSASIRNDDVIAFSDAEQQDKHIHFGKIKKQGGSNTLVSKLGLGPIAQGSILATAQHFNNQFSEVRVYRRRAPSDS